MARSLKLSIITLCSSAALVACSADDGSEDSVSGSAETTAATTQAADDVLGVGDSFDVPCGFTDDSTCMTIEIIDIIDDAQCANGETKNGKFVAVEMSATMPEGADEEFTSPFRSFPWRASTSDNKISKVMDEVSCDDASYLNLMDEFPGYSAEGIAFLDVPADTGMLHFAAAENRDYKISVKGTRDGKSAQSSSSTMKPTDAQQDKAPAPGSQQGGAQQREQPPHTTQQNKQRQAPQSQQIEQEAPGAGEPVIGITQAPGQENPRPLDKQIASCGDASMHQPGTTFFTDGTSGWTQQCASQMGF